MKDSAATRLLSRAALWAACALPCSASDLWVDPLLGDDQASGSSPQTPLATVRHALTMVGAGDVVHLADGTYGLGSGELFPWTLPPGVGLAGVGQAAEVRIDQGTAIRLLAPHPYGATLERLTLIDGDGWGPGVSAVTGLRLLGKARGGDVWRLEDLHCDGLTRGIAAVDPGALSMQGCWWRGASEAIDLRGEVQALLRNCSIEDGRHRGLSLRTMGATATLKLERCDFRSSLGAGLYLDGSPSAGAVPLNAVLEDSVLFGGTRSVLQRNANLEVLRSTLAGSLQDSVLRIGFGQLHLAGSILHSQGSTLPAAADSATYCHLGGGQALASSHLVGGAVKFVNLSAGDLRLRSDSPCVDRGSLQASGLADLVGALRSVDGDLDLERRADLGALEHQVLGGPVAVSVGQPYTLKIAGPLFGYASLSFSRVGLASMPVATVFGTYHLPQGTTTVIAAVRTFGDGGTPIDLWIPNLPSLAGTTYAYQALVRSFQSPAGAVWSDPHTLLVLP